MNRITITVEEVEPGNTRVNVEGVDPDSDATMNERAVMFGIIAAVKDASDKMNKHASPV